MRALALSLIILFAASAHGVGLGTGTCPTSYDIGSNAWADGPHTTNVGGNSRWTIDRLANAGRIIVTIGGFEDDAGFFGTIEPALSSTSSTGFALHFDDGRQVMNLENLVSFIEAVKARVPAGHARPLFFADVRHELLARQEISAAGPMRPTSDWFLRSSRTLTALAAAMTGAGLIAQTDAVCDSVPGGANDGLACGLTMCRSFTGSAIVDGELWGDPDQGTGCGRTYDGTSNKSRGVMLPELIDNIEAGLGDGAAYYKQRSGATTDKVVGFGIAALGNMLDADYVAAKVARCEAYVAMGFDGCAQSHKDHFYATRDNSGVGDAGVVEAWPLIAGDGLGGTASSGTTTPWTDLTTDDGLQPFSGPLLQPDGTTPFEWSERARGDRLISEALDAAGVPVFAYVNAYAFEGCPLDPSTWDDLANYDDTDCDNNYDDGEGTYCETCSMRARGLNADYVLIDVQGKPFDGSEGGLGSGAGSGLSYEDMRGILANFPSPDGTPPVVLGWLSADGYGTGSSSATPPVLCADPNEVNPLTVSTCGNGTLEPGEECDDSDTDPGDGCDQNCRLPHAFVLAGQSNMEGRSTQNQDTDTGRVTSPDPISSHVSRVFRFRYTFDNAASIPPWANANSWPCDDAQCTETGAPGSCAARTAANNTSLDADCKCHCGTTTDAWAADLGEYASAWPTFARRWMQDQNREIEFVSVNRGSSALVAFNDSDNLAGASSWDPTASCTGRSWAATGTETPWKDEVGDLFCAVFEAVSQAGVGGRLKAVLWYQGEQDAHEGVSEATYEAALDTLVDEVWDRLGVPTVIAPLSLCEFSGDACNTITSGNYANIRQAQLDVIASNPHAYRGPETRDLEHVDSVHVQDVIALGSRWAEATAHALVGDSSFNGGNYCGNTLVQVAEECEDGNTVSTDACVNCTDAVCGDGFVWAGTEDCDDGGTADGDGCSSICETEGSTPITAAFTASPVQGSTCVAPCAVHLDATATTATGYTYPFHQLDYVWDCGDSSVTWDAATGGLDRNEPTGPVTGCVYTTSGAKTITLTVSEPQGQTLDVVTQNVTVTSGDSAFPTTSTVCVSTSGTFMGCPSGALQVTSSDFDAALVNSSPNGADAVIAKRRILFRGGETFNADVLVTLFNSADPGMIGTYGTGRAIVSSTRRLSVERGWTITGLTWENTTTSLTSGPTDQTGIDANAGGFDFPAERGNITIFDNSITAGRAGVLGTPSGSGQAARPNLVAIMGNSLIVKPLVETTFGGNGFSMMFLVAERLLLIGNVVDNNLTYRSEFNLRYYSRLGAVQRNYMTDPNATNPRNNIQLRTLTQTGVIFDNELNVISENILDNDQGSTSATAVGSIRVCQQAGCNAATLSYDVTDILIERNLIRCTGSACTTSPTAAPFVIQASQVTVRSNAIDMRGALSTGTTDHTIAYREANNTGCSGCQTDNVWVYGNTYHHASGGTRGGRACNDAQGGSGNICENNLYYTPSDATALTAPTGTWASTAGNVLITAANPFVGSIPAQGSTALTSFELSDSAASPPRNNLSSLTSPASLFRALDMDCYVPATSGNYDTGASQANAVARGSSNCP